MMNVPGWSQEIKNICQELGWKSHVQNMDEHLMIICPLANDVHFSGVLFILSEIANRFMMSVTYRIKATPDSKTAICKTISRINFGLIAGCLEFDSERGEVRYRDGLFLFNIEVNSELLRAFVATTLREALLYCPQIEAIVSSVPEK